MLEIHHGWTLWFQSKRTIRPSENVSPIVNRLIIIFQIASQMWITVKENLGLVPYVTLGTLVYWVHWRKNHLSINTSSISGMKHHISRPCEHLSQINIGAILEICPHNIHFRPTRTTTKDGLIWPPTLGRWHGSTQLCIWPFRPSNNNTLEGRTFCTCKITCHVVTSKVVSVVCCK
jgi:hypothetical protein